MKNDEKNCRIKKTIELIKQNTYEKKNKNNTKPEALILTKDEQIIKKIRDREWKYSGRNSKVENFETKHVDLAMPQIDHHYTIAMH